MSTGYRTRADRLGLVRRIEGARRAHELLHSKEEALERERIRLVGHVGRAERHWRDACDAAAGSLARARMLGAGPELGRLIAAGPPPAGVSPSWTTSMGITYPGDVVCTPGPAAALGATAALVPAIEAYRVALLAAADTAAAGEAVKRLDIELAGTRRRRRAVEEQLLPRLEAARHDLDLRLDELDREEAQRIRTAVHRREGGRS